VADTATAMGFSEGSVKNIISARVQALPRNLVSSGHESVRARGAALKRSQSKSSNVRVHCSAQIAVAAHRWAASARASTRHVHAALEEACAALVWRRFHADARCGDRRPPWLRSRAPFVRVGPHSSQGNRSSKCGMARSEDLVFLQTVCARPVPTRRMEGRFTSGGEHRRRASRARVPEGTLLSRNAGSARSPVGTAVGRESKADGSGSGFRIARISG